MKQTKAIEILSAAKCKFEVLSFEASAFTAQEVSEKLNIPLEQIFKTLVIENEKKEFLMAVVPGNYELSPKKAATAWGCKKCDLCAVNDMQRITGYLKGGCSPLGAKKRLPVIIDKSANNFNEIVVSAGQRGLQIKIAPADLEKYSQAKFAELV